MQAIVLSRRDFRESDQIISLYTLDKGKQEVLARGVKKITSKNSAHLEPFSFVDIEIVPGKEIDHLTKVQPINYFSDIRKDLQKSLSASYVVSLTDKLVHSGEYDERIFELLKGWLEVVNGLDNFNLVFVDCYIVILLYCLGFDITSSEIRNSELQKKLEFLASGDWELIGKLKFEAGEYKKLHNKIYNYLVFQTERKVEDWAKVSQI